MGLRLWLEIRRGFPEDVQKCLGLIWVTVVPSGLWVVGPHRGQNIQSHLCRGYVVWQLDRFPGLRNCLFYPESFTCSLSSASDLQSRDAGEQVRVAGEQLCFWRLLGWPWHSIFLSLQPFLENQLVTLSKKYPSSVQTCIKWSEI